MKRKSLILLAIIMVLSIAFPIFSAFADVIYDPINTFLERNKGKCVGMRRNFYCNGEDGFVSIRSEPGSDREVAIFDNGEILHIFYTYNHNGDIWGVTEFRSSATQEWVSGWAPMDQFLLVYDGISFEADFGHEFYQYTGDYELLFEVDQIVVWIWPGSGEIAFVNENRDSDLERNWLIAAYAYKDNEGREWGLIPYYYAARDYWVCLSDPSNRDIPAFNAAPEPEFKRPGVSNLDVIPNPRPSQTPGVDANLYPDTEEPTGGLPLPALIIILVAAVAAITAVLISVLWKSKKPK